MNDDQFLRLAATTVSLTVIRVFLDVLREKNYSLGYSVGKKLRSVSIIICDSIRNCWRR